MRFSHLTKVGQLCEQAGSLDPRRRCPTPGLVCLFSDHHVVPPRIRFLFRPDSHYAILSIPDYSLLTALLRCTHSNSYMRCSSPGRVAVVGGTGWVGQQPLLSAQCMSGRRWGLAESQISGSLIGKVGKTNMFTEPKAGVVKPADKSS